MSEKRMTLEQFFNELRKTKGWWVSPTTGRIRASIRNRIDAHPDDRNYCPITKVAARRTGRRLPEVMFLDAAKLIGLRADVAYNLADAADDSGAPRLRKRLLAACGLSGVAR